MYLDIVDWSTAKISAHTSSMMFCRRYPQVTTSASRKVSSRGRPSPLSHGSSSSPATRFALVDGTLWPCWSWDGERELWSGKYKTTGHGSLIVTNLQGRITFVSEPVTGNKHDMAKLEGSDVEKILKKGRRIVRRQGIHRDGLRHYSDPQTEMP